MAAAAAATAAAHGGAGASSAAGGGGAVDEDLLRLPRESDGPTSDGRLRGMMSIDHFKLGATVGTGSFSRVRVATHKVTGTAWAIKVLKKADMVRMQQVEHVLNERRLLGTFNHPFIVKLAGTFQDPRRLYLVMEFGAGGEFFTHLRKLGRLENDAARFYAAQVVLIFEYLHKQSIVYRDLKPENLVLDRLGYAHLTDFGFAKRLTGKTYTLCGTPEYLAPEVLLNRGHGKGVDWWTLGIFLFEMLAGQPPFVDDDTMGIYSQIIEGRLVFPKFFERGAKSLIRHLVTQDVARRFGCLRRGADDVKDHKFFLGLDWEALYGMALTAPIVPRVGAEGDVSNFDPYPDSDEETLDPEYEDGYDPFTDF